MTKGSDNIVSIKVMDRSYSVKCPPEQATQLFESAKYLDHQIKKLEQPIAAGNAERMLVIAALNITHELMTYKNKHNANIDSPHEQVKSLQHRIQAFLGQQDGIYESRPESHYEHDCEPRVLTRDALV